LIPTKPTPVDSDDDEKSRGRDGKKKKAKIEKDKDKDPPGGSKDLGSLICNPNPNKDWICSRNYRLIFHKGVNRHTPPFNESGLTTCNKWHAQGHCFEKCERKATNKDFTNDTLKQAYSKWIKEVKDKSPHKSS
jgi:hypothetical protein